MFYGFLFHLTKPAKGSVVCNSVFFVENTAIISIYLVVDVLADKEAPNTLVTHPVVLASLLRAWKLGPSSRETGSTMLGRILQQLRSFSAPR